MTTPTTNQECERIARECAMHQVSAIIHGKLAFAYCSHDHDHGIVVKWQEQTVEQLMPLILTAAARITALKVKATGASEALQDAYAYYNPGPTPAPEPTKTDYVFADIEAALDKLRSLERGEG